MGIVQRSTKWIMLVSGVLTCTMFYAAVAPEASLQANFGETLEGPLAQIIVRNWGVLIGLVGLMLIHGAFNPNARNMALVIAAASKLAFITLILSFGRHLIGVQLQVSMAVDAAMIVLFVLCLVPASARRTA